MYRCVFLLLSDSGVGLAFCCYEYWSEYSRVNIHFLFSLLLDSSSRGEGALCLVYQRTTLQQLHRFLLSQGCRGAPASSLPTLLFSLIIALLVVVPHCAFIPSFSSNNLLTSLFHSWLSLHRFWALNSYETYNLRRSFFPFCRFSFRLSVISYGCRDVLMKPLPFIASASHRRIVFFTLKDVGAVFYFIIRVLWF